jgi:hypothetical protein
MNVLGLIALVMLTLLGYSGGAVIAGREKKRPIDLVELGMAILFLVMACWTGSMLGKWRAIPIWIVLAGLGSILLTKARHKKPVKRQSQGPIANESRGLQRVWNRWKAFSAALGNFQGRLLFAFFYFVAVTPFALALTLFSNPLKAKHDATPSLWLRRNPSSHELDSAREQF